MAALESPQVHTIAQIPVSSKHVSIQDIAQAAGVSHSTVSRALRDSTLISAEVRENIHAIASKMGYVPNALAQSLQGRKTNTIGIIVPTIADPFLADVVAGIESVARPSQYSVLLTATHNDPEIERQGLETFRQRRVDGVIMTTTRGLPSTLALKSNPFVLINNESEQSRPNLHHVIVDDLGGTLLATKHLIHLGHTKIAYVGVSSRTRSNQKRLQGFRDAMDGAGIQIDPNRVIIDACMTAEPDDDICAGRSALPLLLAHDATAAVCYNDMVAIGLQMACRDQDVRVPEALSIVGFDDIPLASYSQPALTTVHQPRKDIGNVGMQTLLNLIDGKPARNLIVSARLITRDTTSPPQARRAVSRARRLAA
jgi:DNA-binding LacI/PurR family transcriptional regulator